MSEPENQTARAAVRQAMRDRLRRIRAEPENRRKAIVVATDRIIGSEQLADPPSAAAGQAHSAADVAALPLPSSERKSSDATPDVTERADRATAPAAGWADRPDHRGADETQENVDTRPDARSDREPVASQAGASGPAETSDTESIAATERVLEGVCHGAGAEGQMMPDHSPEPVASMGRAEPALAPGPDVEISHSSTAPLEPAVTTAKPRATQDPVRAKVARLPDKGRDGASGVATGTVASEFEPAGPTNRPRSSQPVLLLQADPDSGPREAPAPPLRAAGSDGAAEAQPCDSDDPRSAENQDAPPEVPGSDTEPADAIGAGSDLLELPGAGDGLVWLLQEHDINSLADLARADPAELGARMDLVGRLINLESWVAFARERAAMPDQPESGGDG